MNAEDQTEVYGIGWGNPSLRNIIELELPEPVSLIPATPGWWLLLAALTGLLLRAAWRRRQRYLRDRYRRDALDQISCLKQQLAEGSLEAVRELAPLLRATAIAAAGRETMAGLQGENYATALADLVPDRAPKQQPVPVADLEYLAYAPLDDIDHIDIAAVVTAVECWTRNHRGTHA